MKKPINGLKAHATDPSVVVDDLGGRVLFPIRVFLSSSCSMSPLTGLLFRRLRAYTATERDREARRKPFDSPRSLNRAAPDGNATGPLDLGTWYRVCSNIVSRNRAWRVSARSFSPLSACCYYRDRESSVSSATRRQLLFCTVYTGLDLTDAH